MIRFVWHAAVVMTVFGLIQNSTARIANAATYQHLNDNAIQSSQSSEDPVEDSNASDTFTSALWKDLSLVYRIYHQCSSENLSVCLKVKLLAGLERVVRAARALKLTDGVQFVKSGDENDKVTSAQPRAAISEQDIEAVLPRSLVAKEQVLNNLIFKKVAAFLQDHTLQVKFPDLRAGSSWANNSVEGRRKKDKKGGGAYIMIPLLLGGTFVPIAYGALAMLAGKALIVSKLALVLASIIGIKKLLSGGGGKESAHEVVVSGGHSGWGRDMDLAYNGWKPAQETSKSM